MVAPERRACVASSARLEGKIAIITGAGSGIGEAVALRFVREGARVIGVSLSDNALRVAERAGDRMEGRRCDVSDPAAVAALMDHCRRAYGRLDVLVSYAAIAPPGFPRLHEASIEQWDAVMNVNQRGAFLVLKYALPLMLESGGGAIVNMASIGAFRASPNASAYLTSKGALVSLTRAAAIEYLKDKIRVNAVCPGMTRTVTASARLIWPLPARLGNLSSTLTLYHRSETNFQDIFNRCNVTTGECLAPNLDSAPAYSVYNFSTLWKGVLGTHLDLTGYAKNLTNKKYVVYQSPQASLGYAATSFGEPLTFGFGVRYTFYGSP